MKAFGIVKQAAVPSTPPADGEAQGFQAGRVITIAVGHTVHDMYASFLAPLLPTFITNLALSKTEAGLLMVFLQSPSVLQPVIGNMADRMNLRALVILGPAVTGVLMSLLGVAPAYGVLALMLTLAGFSSAAFHSVAPPLAGRLAGRRLGRGIGFWMVGGEMGYTIGPILLVSATQVLGVRGLPWLMIIGALTALFMASRLSAAQTAPARGAQVGSWRQVLPGMKPLLLPLIGITILRSPMVAALTTFLPVFLRDGGASLWVAGASLSILQAAGVAGALAAGSVSDSLGRRRTLVLLLATAPLCMLAFLSTRGLPQVGMLLLLGFTSLCVPTVLTALVQENFPEHRALANGVYGSMNFIIYALAVALAGAIGDWIGLRAAFTLGAGATLAALPLLLMLPSRAARPASDGTKEKIQDDQVRAD